jgi:hypothetical protein
MAGTGISSFRGYLSIVRRVVQLRNIPAGARIQEERLEHRGGCERPAGKSEEE